MSANIAPCFCGATVVLRYYAGAAVPPQYPPSPPCIRVDCEKCGTKFAYIIKQSVPTQAAYWQTARLWNQHRKENWWR